uniref:Ribosomal protein L2 n=1 Tax=Cyanophora biloba TaxID=1489483 RepID=A0A873WYM8_9EUKA|nr:ribosomal protein L2 [Cyanophora biloba]QPB15010.1 ribosomal protein L2 [Cyanophora biloba]
MISIKKKPVTPSLRFFLQTKRIKKTKNCIPKLLFSPILGIKKGGRNNLGRIVIRHRGGGHKKNYYITDYKRHFNQIYLVKALNYTPNKSAFLATLYNYNGFISNVLATSKLKTGDIIINSDQLTEYNTFLRGGNTYNLLNISTGTLVNNVEVNLKHGGQLIRAAGTYAQIMAHNKTLNYKFKNYTNNIENEKYSAIRLPSGEIRLVSSYCKATIGSLSNQDHKLRRIGKAGRSRWLNKRPSVRGIAMNPVDHPHGGRTNGGRPSVTPYGRFTKGKPTTKFSNRKRKFILKKKK